MTKRLIALMLALSCAILSMLALSACAPTVPEKCETCVDDDNDGKCDVCGGEVEPITPDLPDDPTTYTFTFTALDYAGAPISGLQVKFLYQGTETEVYTTGANGKVIAEIATEREVIAEFVDLEGWSAPKKKAMTYDAMEYNLTVNLTPTVKLVAKNADGELLSGVTVSICSDGGCSQDVATDENGVAELAVKPIGDYYKIRVSAVPDGYVVPEAIIGADTPLDKFDDYHFTFDIGEGEYVIVIPTAG